MTTTELIFVPLEWKADASHKIFEPCIGSKAVEVGLRQLLNSHHATLIRLLQPLKRGLPITKACVHNGHVHRRDVLLSGQRLQFIKNPQRLYLASRTVHTHWLKALDRAFPLLKALAPSRVPRSPQETRPFSHGRERGT